MEKKNSVRKRKNCNRRVRQDCIAETCTTNNLRVRVQSYGTARGTCVFHDSVKRTTVAHRKKKKKNTRTRCTQRTRVCGREQGACSDPHHTSATAAHGGRVHTRTQSMRTASSRSVRGPRACASITLGPSARATRSHVHGWGGRGRENTYARGRPRKLLLLAVPRPPTTTAARPVYLLDSPSEPASAAAARRRPAPVPVPQSSSSLPHGQLVLLPALSRPITNRPVLSFCRGGLVAAHPAPPCVVR